jgi:hypothetical protein
MRRSAAVVSLAAAVLWAASAFAQAKPNFSGTWTRDAAAAGAAGGGGGGGAAGGRGGGGGQRGGGGGGGGFACQATCKITQDATTLKVDRMQGETALPTWTLKLDGTDSPNTGRGRGDQPPPTIVSKASWNGDKLVVSTSRQTQDGATVTATQTLWLEGGKLVVETNSGMAGATPAKSTYTKS